MQEHSDIEDKTSICEITGSYSCEYKDESLLGYSASIIILMMEAVPTSETFVYSNETTWHYIPEGSLSLIFKISIACI
jgi:hypothetical protein